MKSLQSGTDAVVRASNGLFAFALLLLVGFILYLPVFPNGDGPMHLYFSSILWSLSKHQAEYAHYFAIRHLIAPYSLHYFALIFFGTFLSPANAEKLFATVTVLNLALGFRFLAGRLGSNAAVASLWMIPLLLSWSLGGGFFNFCFAIGVSFWSFAFWTMLPPVGSSLAFLGFFVALVVLVLSHPVPLLVLVLFLASDLFLVWLDARRFPEQRRMRGYGFRLAAFALTCLAMVVPALIADKSKVAAIWPDLHPHVDLLKEMIKGTCLGMFGGKQPLQLLYTVGLLIIVPGAVFLLGRQMYAHWRAGGSTAADRLVLTSVVFLACTLCFPHALNGSYYFPQRLWDVLWPLILACTAAAVVSSRGLRALAIGGAVLILITGVITVRTLTPAARMQAATTNLKFPAGSTGIFLEPKKATDFYVRGFTYPVFYWSGARGLVQSHAILLNSPWMELSILPVKENGRAGLLIDDLESTNTGRPFTLLETMSTPSPKRDLALRHADAIVYADPTTAHPDLDGPMQKVLEDQQPQWTCTKADFYEVCTRKH